jgi:hypothetical protein
MILHLYPTDWGFLAALLVVTAYAIKAARNPQSVG